MRRGEWHRARNRDLVVAVAFSVLIVETLLWTGVVWVNLDALETVLRDAPKAVGAGIVFGHTTVALILSWVIADRLVAAHEAGRVSPSIAGTFGGAGVFVGGVLIAAGVLLVVFAWVVIIAVLCMLGILGVIGLTSR